MKHVSQPNLTEIEQRGVYLPDSKFEKTIIFDLDETLVHCIDDIENTYFDLPISVKFPTGETIEAGINVRPFAYECLKIARENYQVVIFTASHKAYADVVLDTLEKEFKKEKYLTLEESQVLNSLTSNSEKQNYLMQLKQKQKLFDFRLYRDHCIRTTEGIYIKDLRILKNRDLSQVIIVDNAVYSFGYQLDNGIPIIPYYSPQANIDDEELMHLVYYFNCVAASQDIRIQNRKAFQLHDLQELDISQQLKIMQKNNIQQCSYQNNDDEKENGINGNSPSQAGESQKSENSNIKQGQQRLNYYDNATIDEEDSSEEEDGKTTFNNKSNNQNQ